MGSGATVPSGTVTFLFTDVEGSTRLWERHRDQMQAALEIHDRVLREVIEGRGGYVFTTAGDAFAAAFATAADGVAAAVAVQRTLAEAPWPPEVALRVRIGLHSGEAQERDGDYFGPTLNRSARIMSAAHGGQVLTSTTVRELMVSDGEIAFRSLGAHHLKDLTEPQEVFQVLADGLDETFPPVRSLESRPNNLPSVLSNFVGRHAELAALSTELASHRLVTITGAGGAGKSRLAMEIGAKRLDSYPDGVWLVELAPLSDAALVVPEILGRLQLSTPADQSPLQSLCAQVEDRSLLLIIDNCEHLIDHVAAVTRTLLEAAPGVTVLATSREPLQLSGECVWPIPVMAITTTGASDAVRLFLDRASTDEELALSAVARVCRRLDGLPLAIELAAARLRSLSLAELEQRLDDRFRILTGGDRTGLPHHRTLRTTVQWSYDLLGEQAKEVYRRVAVFAGGFSLDAAEAVATSEDVLDFEVLDQLDQLVGQSLLGREPSTGRTRYRMLETMRQHAQELLAENDETNDAFSELLDWAIAHARAASPMLQGADQREWVDLLIADIDNFNAALGWALDHDPVRGLSLTTALSFFWWVYSDAASDTTPTRSLLPEGARWAKAMIDRADDDAPRARRAAAQNALGGLLQFRLGEYSDALANVEEAAEVFEELGDDRRLGVAMLYATMASYTGPYAGDDTAWAHAERGLEAARRCGDASTEGFLLWQMAVMAHLQRRPEAAELFASFVATCAGDDTPFVMGHCHDYSTVWASLTDSVVDPADFIAAIDAFTQTRQLTCVAHTAESMALWQQRLGNPIQAATLLGVALGLRDKLGIVAPHYENYTPWVEEAGLRHLDRAQRDEATGHGRALPLEEAIAYLRSMAT